MTANSLSSRVAASMKYSTWIVVVAMVFLVLWATFGGLFKPVGHTLESVRNVKWTCSMDPQFVMEQPGKCPKCFMDLIPLAAGAALGGPNEFFMDEKDRESAGITLAEVKRGEAAMTLRLAGVFNNSTTLSANLQPADIDLVKAGTTVKVEDLASPGDLLPAKVDLVSGTTAKIILATPVKGTAKRPGRAYAEIPLDDKGQPAQKSGSTLLVPGSAVLSANDRQFVFVERIRDDAPVFLLREITAGPKTASGQVVLDGVKEGDMVVASGVFRLDSSRQILGKISLMNLPEGSLPPDWDAPRPAFLPARPADHDVRSIYQFNLDQWFQNYEKVRAALAVNNDAEARLAALEMNDLLINEKVPDELATWRDELRRQSRILADAKQLEDRRAAFRDMTNTIVPLARIFGSPKTGLRLVFCPMAFNYKGAYWVQPGDTVDNPYHGLEMQRCGIIDEIVPAYGEEAPKVANEDEW